MKSSLPTLPASVLPSFDPSETCPPCAMCCKYVSLGMEAPENVKNVSMALWALHHRGIGIYQGHDDEWYLLVRTECEHLRPDGLCGIYENRPFICRDYDVAVCEGTVPEPAHKLEFMETRPFVAWLRRSRPTLYQRCLEKGIIPEALRAGQ